MNGSVKKFMAAVVLTLGLSGCDHVESVKVFFPTAFGMDELTTNLYVDKTMPAGNAHGCSLLLIKPERE